MFECATHSSSTKVPISTTSSTPSCSAFVWLSSRETLQPRQPRTHAAAQVARISRIDSTAELAALVASSNSDRSTMPDSAEVAHVSAMTCIRFRLACALKVIQAQRPWHEAGPRPVRLHSPPLARATRSKTARIPASRRAAPKLLKMFCRESSLLKNLEDVCVETKRLIRPPTHPDTPTQAPTPGTNRRNVEY
jgi:hypothetical protein